MFSQSKASSHWNRFPRRAVKSPPWWEARSRRSWSCPEQRGRIHGFMEMPFQLCLCSSGANKTMTQNSCKINYPSWSAVDMVWDSWRLRIVKLVKPKPVAVVWRQRARKPGIRGSAGSTQRLVGGGAVHRSGSAGPPCPPPGSAPSEGLGVTQPWCPACPRDIWRKPGPVGREGALVCGMAEAWDCRGQQGAGHDCPLRCRQIS